MQMWQWGELKATTGPWSAHRVVCERDGKPVGGAQILVRSLPWPFASIAYAPRGPVAENHADDGEVAERCARWCGAHFHTVALKIDPPATRLALPDGWVTGSHVLMATTAIVDLRPEADAIMKSLHARNARNYIRRGARVGIEVGPGTAEDVNAVIAIYHETAAHDGFPIHPDAFYHQAFRLLGDVGQLTVARYQGDVVAFMWNVTSRWGASELWAGANATGRRMRANYPLKWGAMLTAKRVGAERYDMNGLLNSGISEFKKSFQNQPTVWAGTFDRPLSPLYGPWVHALTAYNAVRHGIHKPRERATNS